MKTGILLSGGIDSAALAFWLRPDIAFTVNYGQLSANGEIRAAKKIAQEIGIPHEVIIVNCGHLGSGDLAGSPSIHVAPVSEWWPFRNQLIITLVSMRAVAIGVDELLFGSVTTDGIHIDGKKEFFEVMNEVVSMQEGRIRISSPAIEMTSVQLVQASNIDPSILLWTHSCHKAEYACGDCRGCTKHRSTMIELGYVHD